MDLKSVLGGVPASTTAWKKKPSSFKDQGFKFSGKGEMLIDNAEIIRFPEISTNGVF